MGYILRRTQEKSSVVCVRRFARRAIPSQPETMREIGEVIREVRKSKGLRLDDIAHAVGTDAGNISRLERGQQGYSEERIKAVASALGVSLGHLWVLATLDPEELEILENYRHATHPEREAVRTLLAAARRRPIADITPIRKERRSGRERRSGLDRRHPKSA